MRFRARNKFRLGPLFVNLAQGRFSSWGIRLGRLNHNVTNGETTFDTPGPGHVTSGRRRRRSR